MPFRKRWNGSSSGNLTTLANYDPVNVRSSAYRWQPSSTSGEYYLQTSGGASPGFTAAPSSVQLDGTDITTGSLGSLAASRWAYGDNDTLGYNTIYVRTADTVDPDLKAVGFVTFRALPLAGDHLTIPAGSGAINAGLNALYIALGEFVVEDGMLSLIGSSSAPLRLYTVTKFEFSGLAVAYIDLGSITADIQVLKTAPPASSGTYGLYLTGGDVGKLNVVRGTVGLAVRNGDVATFDEVRCAGADATVILGPGTNVGTIYQSDGSVVQRCDSTLTQLEGGDFRSEESGAIATLDILSNDRPKRVMAVLNSTGTVGELNQKNTSSTVDLLQSAAAREITEYNFEAGDLYWDGNTVDIPTLNTPSGGPFRLRAEAA